MLSVTPISGGDISMAQKIETLNGLFFAKSASFPDAQAMFEKEVIGLKELQKTKTIGVPKVIGLFQESNLSCLIMEFIEPKPADSNSMESLGRKLAQLHRFKNEGYFGFESDNKGKW